MWTFRYLLRVFLKREASGLEHDRTRADPAHPDLLARAEVVLVPTGTVRTRNPDQPAVSKQDVVDRDIALSDIVGGRTLGHRGRRLRILVQVHFLRADRHPHGRLLLSGYTMRNLD